LSSRFSKKLGESEDQLEGLQKNLAMQTADVKALAKALAELTDGANAE
jgi:septal ring factor EnvC (AmiA/AmiB activator)